jgi:hypothetical protein
MNQTYYTRAGTHQTAFDALLKSGSSEFQNAARVYKGLNEGNYDERGMAELRNHLALIGFPAPLWDGLLKHERKYALTGNPDQLAFLLVIMEAAIDYLVEREKHDKRTI